MQIRSPAPREGSWLLLQSQPSCGVFLIAVGILDPWIHRKFVPIHRSFHLTIEGETYFANSRVKAHNFLKPLALFVGKNTATEKSIDLLTSSVCASCTLLFDIDAHCTTIHIILTIRTCQAWLGQALECFSHNLLMPPSSVQLYDWS